MLPVSTASAAASRRTAVACGRKWEDGLRLKAGLGFALCTEASPPMFRHKIYIEIYVYVYGTLPFGEGGDARKGSMASVQKPGVRRSTACR